MNTEHTWTEDEPYIVEHSEGSSKYPQPFRPNSHYNYYFNSSLDDPEEHMVPPSDTEEIPPRATASLSMMNSMEYIVTDIAQLYDFCIVLPSENGTVTQRGEGYIENLRLLGFEMFAYQSLEHNGDVIILLRTPLPKLRAIADKINFEMLLDSKQIENQLRNGDPERGIRSVEIPSYPDVSRYHPYEYIYGKYSRQVDEEIYWKEKDSHAHPFREIVRLKLSAILLESHPRIDLQNMKITENLKIQRYLKNGWMKGCFPFHHEGKRKELQRKISSYPFQSFPFDEFKEYFGEQMGIYFTFVHHYVLFLLRPAVIGIPLQIAVWVTDDYNAPFLPFFAVFIALWSVGILEMWKRKEKRFAMHWGMLGFEDSEVNRADFRGDDIKSFIDGSWIRYFPTKKRRSYLFQSSLGIIAMIVLVIGIVVSIYVMRFAIRSLIGITSAQVVASIANSVQIIILNAVYTFIANVLTERENHRTNTDFEDSLILKIFLFQFVNSYSSFFYLAFVAQYVGDCPADGCMSSLAINLAIIFGTRLVLGFIMQIVIPYIQYHYFFKKKLSNYEDHITRPEKESLLINYDTQTDRLQDYSEICIQFGYTALFITALPIAGFFACLSSIAEIKGDAWRLLHLHKRPFPKGAEDIGMWQTIFFMISIISVLTNAGLTVFTMDTLRSYSQNFRFWVFILFQWVCFALQALIIFIIPSIPEEIHVQMQRKEFIVKKLIEKTPDDNENDIIGRYEPLIIQPYPHPKSSRKSSRASSPAVSSQHSDNEFISANPSSGTRSRNGRKSPTSGKKSTSSDGKKKKKKSSTSRSSGGKGSSGSPTPLSSNALKKKSNDSLSRMAPDESFHSGRSSNVTPPLKSILRQPEVPTTQAHPVPLRPMSVKAASPRSDPPRAPYELQTHPNRSNPDISYNEPPPHNNTNTTSQGERFNPLEHPRSRQGQYY